MRILSQTGIVDLPYERIGISRNDTEIVATPIADSNPQERYWALAEYSTESKARKAMDMLRGAYCGEIYMKCGDYEIADIDLSQELEKKIREEMSKSKFLTTVPNPVIECKIFQFPSDEEVEVWHDAEFHTQRLHAVAD